MTERRVPVVSVVMAVRNQAETVQLAIMSVLIGDLSDIEVIAVNDASTDGTRDKLEGLAAVDSRLKVVHNSERLERAATRNIGILSSRGDFIAILDADDVSMRERLAVQLNLMQAHPEIAVCGTWAYETDDKLHVVGRLQPPVDDKELRKGIILRNPFVHSSIMLRRTSLMEAGLYDTNLKQAEDHELLWRVSKHGDLHNIPRHLVLRTINFMHEARRNRSARLASVRVKMNICATSRAFSICRISLLPQLFLAMLPGRNVAMMRIMMRKIKYLSVREEDSGVQLWIDEIFRELRRLGSTSVK